MNFSSTFKEQIASQHTAGVHFVQNRSTLNNINMAFLELENKAARPDTVLKSLATYLNSSKGSDKIVQKLIDFLDSGRDVVLEQNFSVGSEGKLTGTPSLRVFLLDSFAYLDSEAAGQYAKKVLENSTKVEEWAVALRNFAWGMPDAWKDKFFSAKISELIANSEWAASPSPAFLESFDALVFAKSWALLPDLLKFTDSFNPTELQHASRLCLERLIARDPLLAMNTLLGQSLAPDQLWLRELSFLYARPERENERQLLERYLLTTRGQELHQFFQAFPLQRKSAGNFLITSIQPVSLVDQAYSDRAMLAWLDNLLRDDRFLDIHSDLLKVRENVWGYVQAAASAGY